MTLLYSIFYKLNLTAVIFKFENPTTAPDSLTQAQPSQQSNEGVSYQLDIPQH